MRHGQRNDLMQGAVGADEHPAFDQTTGAARYVRKLLHLVFSLDAYLRPVCLRIAHVVT